MRVETILENFDLLAEIQGAVAKLRELILELAVRGKLVEQDPEDEPAAMLLNRVHAERRSLDRSRLLGAAQNSAALTTAEQDFELPDGWQWVRLADYALDISTGPFGSSLHKADYMVGGIPLINPSHIVNGRIVPEASVSVSGVTAERLRSYRLRVGDVVMARRGEVGRAAVVTEAEEGWLCGTGSFFLRFGRDSSREFIVLLLRCSSVRAYLAGKAVGTTMVNLNHGILRRMPLALPPLPEQRRIVAKVDQLMALCDELERRQQARREGRERLCTAALNALTSAADADEVTVQWERIRQNFGEMFGNRGDVRKLRQCVHELGISGRLVPQDPAEEPAGALLERVDQERSEAAKLGHLKIKSAGNNCDTIQAVGCLPPSWCSTRLGRLLVFGPTNGLSPRASETPTDTKAVTLTATTSGRFDGRYFKYVNVALPEDSHLWLRPGDILIQRGNSWEYVGVAAVYKGPGKAFIYPDLMMKVRTADVLDVDFIHLVLNSSSVRSFFRAQATGTSGSMPKINQSVVVDAPIGLPPVKEQRRIVARVSQLMALCDDLEAKLKQAEEDGMQMLDVVIRSICDAASGAVAVTSDYPQPDDNGSSGLRNGSVRGNGIPEKPLRAIPSERASSRNGSVEHVAIPLPRSAAEPARSHRVDTDQRALFTETEAAASSERPRPIEEIPVEEVMAAFRRASRGAGRLSEEDLLRETALELGYRRLGPKIRERLKGHLRAAIRRRIIARDGDVLYCATPTIASCDDDVLLRALGSLMKKTREYEVGEIVDMVAEHLGFARVTAAMQERIGEVIRAGRKAGVLGTKGKWVWREG
jgi:type I restriction enzyme, S subunit